MSGTTGLNRPDWERWPGAPCQPNDVCCGPATHKHTSALHTEPRPGVVTMYMYETFIKMI